MNFYVNLQLYFKNSDLFISWSKLINFWFLDFKDDMQKRNILVKFHFVQATMLLYVIT